MTNKINHRGWKWKFGSAAGRVYEFLYPENYDYRMISRYAAIDPMDVALLLCDCESWGKCLNGAEIIVVKYFNWICYAKKLTSITISARCLNERWYFWRCQKHKNANRYSLFLAFPSFHRSIWISVNRYVCASEPTSNIYYDYATQTNHVSEHLQSSFILR